LHQSVARVARHALVRVSAARCAAETHYIRKVQDLSMKKMVSNMKAELSCLKLSAKMLETKVVN
jgi:hypothetical protein